jgi:hypothetical protein
MLKVLIVEDDLMMPTPPKKPSSNAGTEVYRITGTVAEAVALGGLTSLTWRSSG